MIMKKFIPLIIFILIASTAASADVIPPYTEWKFHYSADYSNFTTNGTTARITVKNGVAWLVSHLDSPLKKGTKIILEISTVISQESVNAGLKVSIANETILERKLINEHYSLQFYAQKTYEKGENISLIFYDVGGEMVVEISGIYFEMSEGGLNEGLLLTGVGISVVFVILSILAGIMYLLKPRKKRNENYENMSFELNDETIAVIATAVAMYLEGKKFRIISVKQSPWKYYGRLKIMRRLK